jgi:hypothetical protein
MLINLVGWINANRAQTPVPGVERRACFLGLQQHSYLGIRLEREDVQLC